MTTVLAYEVVNWQECPNGHAAIEGGPVQIDGQEAWQLVWCSECHLHWTEVYRASSRVIES